ncbi:MAG: hypothetical protein ACPGYP_02270 [Solirubrobacterales bacterium]
MNIPDLKQKIRGERPERDRAVSEAVEHEAVEPSASTRALLSGGNRVSVDSAEAENPQLSDADYGALDQEISRLRVDDLNELAESLKDVRARVRAYQATPK